MNKYGIIVKGKTVDFDQLQIPVNLPSIQQNNQNKNNLSHKNSFEQQNQYLKQKYVNRILGDEYQKYSKNLKKLQMKQEIEREKYEKQQKSLNQSPTSFFKNSNYSSINSLQSKQQYQQNLPNFFNDISQNDYILQNLTDREQNKSKQKLSPQKQQDSLIIKLKKKQDLKPAYSQEINKSQRLNKKIQKNDVNLKQQKQESIDNKKNIQEKQIKSILNQNNTNDNNESLVDDISFQNSVLKKIPSLNESKPDIKQVKNNYHSMSIDNKNINNKKLLNMKNQSEKSLLINSKANHNISVNSNRSSISNLEKRDKFYILKNLKYKNYKYEKPNKSFVTMFELKDLEKEKIKRYYKFKDLEKLPTIEKTINNITNRSLLSKNEQILNDLNNQISETELKAIKEWKKKLMDKQIQVKVNEKLNFLHKKEKINENMENLQNLLQKKKNEQLKNQIQNKIKYGDKQIKSQWVPPLEKDLNQKAYILKNMKKLEEAIKIYEQIIEKTEENSDEEISMKVDALIGLGDSKYQNDLEMQYLTLQKAQKILKKLKNGEKCEQMACINQQIADIFTKQGKYQEALELKEDSCKILDNLYENEQNEDQKQVYFIQQALMYEDIGKLVHYLENQELAFEYFLNAKKRWEKIDSYGQNSYHIRLTNTIGQKLIQNGEIEKGKKELNWCLDKIQPNNPQHIDMYIQISLIFHTLQEKTVQNLKQQLKETEKFLNMAEQHQLSLESLVGLYEHIANLLIHNKKYKRAQVYITQLDSLIKKNNLQNSPVYPRVLYLDSILQFQKENFVQGLKQMETALDLAKTLISSNDKMFLDGKILLGKNRTLLGVEQMELDVVNQGISDLDEALLIMKDKNSLENLKHKKDIYQFLLNFYLQMQYYNEALNMLEALQKVSIEVLNGEGLNKEQIEIEQIELNYKMSQIKMICTTALKQKKDDESKNNNINIDVSNNNRKNQN
ncbi:hypothetical protein PPERSA_04416 [Pseudocohnilembus persalinus]|uniref:Tetratricopeptide repeat protein n=1 Tax=Pseudocohnilembus persalinus TaxID=266149 RepID=A0A0V0QQP8_PSEPJ|nr:hypothetical protein PPERSA_04416 [Pseudocohnilembus persalinus]|eukprot:KRX04601.1 hypothetical protein PPERSA_04416 [Pseudocohnilembus persalinus]